MGPYLQDYIIKPFCYLVTGVYWKLINSYVRLNELWTVSIRSWYDTGENKKKNKMNIRRWQKMSDATQQVERSETYQLG